jgi:hypothetical protein
MPNPPANWTQKGATLSHKNACKEFGLTEEQILRAMHEEKLQYKQNWAHGNPYYRLLKAEVEQLAREIHGGDGLALKRLDHEIATTKKEINSHKRKLTALEKQMQQLLEKKQALTAE